MKDLLFKSEFYEDLNYIRFFIGMLLLIVLTRTLQFIYRKYSSSPTNKKSFSGIFILFSVSIFLIVTTIKSSLALSLGMVGALSIIRFRTAIKEPEQLIYFLGITGVAIAIAAEKEILAVLVVLVFVLSAILNNKKKGNSVSEKLKYLMINFKLDTTKEEQNKKTITQLLSPELKGNLKCKNFTEDNSGNVGLVFTISNADELNLDEVKQVLTKENIINYTLKMID